MGFDYKRYTEALLEDRGKLDDTMLTLYKLHWSFMTQPLQHILGNKGVLYYQQQQDCLGDFIDHQEGHKTPQALLNNNDLRRLWNMYRAGLSEDLPNRFSLLKDVSNDSLTWDYLYDFRLWIGQYKDMSED